jgi:hypothetical protein
MEIGAKRAELCGFLDNARAPVNVFWHINIQHKQ